MEAAVDRQQAKQTTTGAVLIASGVLLFISQLDWGPVWSLGRLWPVVMVAVGLPGLLFGDKEGNRGGSLCVTLSGMIFFLHTLRILSLRDSWPLFIVAAGAAMFLDGIVRRAPKPKGEV